MKSLSSRIIKQVSSVGIGAGTVVSFISDFLIPIAPFALWLGLASLTLFIIMALFRLAVPTSKPPVGYEGIWFAPVALSTIFFSIVCLTTYYYSIQYKSIDGENKGFLASNIEVVEVLQNQSLSLEIIKEIQEKILSENEKTNASLEASKEALLDSLNEQIKINEAINKSRNLLAISLEEQLKINEVLSSSNKTLIEQKEIQKNIYESAIKNLENNISINNKTKNIEAATFLSFKSLKESLISGDLNTLKEFSSKNVDLGSVNKKASEYESPMIIEMVHQNKKNPEEILEYLLSLEAVDLEEEHKLSLFSNVMYYPFWQLFIERTVEVDDYIVKGASFKSMQKGMEKKYGYIIPDALEEKYYQTVPSGAENFDSKNKKYYYSGAWLNSNAISISITLYSASLISENKKAVDFLEKRKANKIGFYLMPSGVKILLDPRFLKI